MTDSILFIQICALTFSLYYWKFERKNWEIAILTAGAWIVSSGMVIINNVTYWPTALFCFILFLVFVLDVWDSIFDLMTGGGEEHWKNLD